MPVPLEVMDLNQRAVLWEKTGVDAYGDDIVSPSPQEISVRWVPTKMIVKDPQGQPVQVDAVMTTGTSVALGSVCWLGELADLPGTGTLSQPDNGLHQVVRLQWARDLRGVYTRNDYALSRLTDEVPLGDAP